MAAWICLGCFLCFSRKQLQFLLPIWVQSSDAWSWPVASPCFGEMRTSLRSPKALHHLMPATIDQSLSRCYFLSSLNTLSLVVSRYLEHSHLIPAYQFAYRKNLVTSDAILSISHKIQQALDHGHEARVVWLDFSSAFDQVNHANLLRKLQ